MKGKQIIILVLVGLVIVLMIQNSVLVKFHLLFWPGPFTRRCSSSFWASWPWD